MKVIAIKPDEAVQYHTLLKNVAITKKNEI